MMGNIPISLQLYTLREEMEKDFLGTLKKVAQIGYAGVEFAGYGNLSADRLKEELDKLGLVASGSHVGLDLLRNNLEEVIKYNLIIGNKYIICPWSDFKDKAEVLELAIFLNEVGKECKKNGLQLCYHNHAHEFKEIDGLIGLDFLYLNTKTEALKAEIDTYWVKRAEIEPIEYMKKYKGRCPLIHLKDMEDSEEKFYTEIGSGTMDIKGIAYAAKEIGAAWLVVEQDECRKSPLESIKISFENLKTMGLV